MKFPTYLSIFRQQEVVQILHELDKLLKQQIELVASKSSQIKIWEIDDKLRNKALIKKFFNELIKSSSKAKRQKFLLDCNLEITRVHTGEYLLHITERSAIFKDYFKETAAYDYF